MKIKKPVIRLFAAVEPFLIDDQVYSFVDGVTVGLRQCRAGDSVYVMKIRSIDRGKGKASQTLDHICEIADSNAVVLFLEVEESD